jgi:hypothetical protein
MQKLILEVCDANHAALCEPVFLEHLHDLPMGVKRVVEDFIEAHEGEVATPLVITARAEDEEAMPGFSFLDELQTTNSHHAHEHRQHS